MTGFLDRSRASRLMAERELDAIVLIQPESIVYAAGAHPGVATLWRRAGAAALLVPADPVIPLAAVVGDLQAEDFRRASEIDDVRAHPIWIETTRIDPAARDLMRAIATADRLRPAGFARPATFDPALALEALGQAMADRRLATGSIGIELGFVPAADLPAFEAAAPGARWRDATRIVELLRLIKHPVEIERLRLAADLTTLGLRQVLDALAPGRDATALVAIWRESVAAGAQRRQAGDVTSWAYIAVGKDGFAPGGPAVSGDVVKIDVGAVVSGYSADMARTAVIGSPTSEQSRVHSALAEAFEAALAALRPGRPLREAHQAATLAMRRSGFRT
jgi:Xaa-Pro dipeptidase